MKFNSIQFNLFSKITDYGYNCKNKLIKEILYVDHSDKQARCKNILIQNFGEGELP